MPKFMYLYRGPATPVPERTPEEHAARMAAFSAWIEKVGTALVDAGSPFGPGRSIRDDGVESAAGDFVGYSVVEANDIAAATAMTDGLPLLAGHTGAFSIEVFELQSM